MHAKLFAPQRLVSGLALALPSGFAPLRRVRDALAARRAVRELAQLDDRLLHDIGLDRGEVQRLLARPAPLAGEPDEGH